MRSVVFLTAILLLVSACDRFYGPSFRNTIRSDIEIEVTYHDGKVFRHVLPYCQGIFLGGVNDPTITAVRMVVRKDGKVLYDLDAQQLADFRRREEEKRGYSKWSIEEDGIHFEDHPDQEWEKGCQYDKPRTEY